jgi:hypothetical protein
VPIKKKRKRNPLLPRSLVAADVQAIHQRASRPVILRATGSAGILNWSLEVTVSVKTIDPDMKLDGCRLRDALESVYHTFASVLLGRGATTSPDLFMRDIPEMVFDVAIGAGWIPLAENRFDQKIGTSKGDVVWEADWQIPKNMKLPKMIVDHLENLKKEGKYAPPHKTTFTTNQLQRIVRFDEWYVERAYLDSFYNLLREAISFHLGEGTLHEERLKSLPATTTARQRQALLTAYISKRMKEGKSTRITDIAKLANVDYSVFMKWRKGESVKNGPILDSHPAAQRISMRLRFDERMKARPYRRTVER